MTEVNANIRQQFSFLLHLRIITASKQQQKITDFVKKELFLQSTLTLNGVFEHIFPFDCYFYINKCIKADTYCIYNLKNLYSYFVKKKKKWCNIFIDVLQLSIIKSGNTVLGLLCKSADFYFYFSNCRAVIIVIISPCHELYYLHCI